MSTTATDPTEEQAPRPSLRRRAFLAGTGAGIAGTGLAAFTAAAGWPTTSGAQDDHDMSSGDTTEMTDEEMLAHHKEGIEQFLANAEDPLTEGVPIQPLESTVVDGVRVFEMTASDIEWEVTPGETFEAMAFNGQVPGPLIRCTEGERIRVIVHNEMAQSTSIHWHGQMVPNDQDGVPFVTQDPIKPGTTYTYEFVAKPAGSHMYHSHNNSTEQVGKGLLGPLIVDPKEPIPEHEVDHDHVLILNDALGGFTINGKGFPATTAYKAKVGEKIRFRYMNEGLAIHPMHLHGFPQEVITKDGWPLPAPYKCDTVNIAPGERYDVIVTVEDPGIWVFHCHILTHAEGPDGMFGMVTALIVEE